jgi:BirA family biotin operon repressor/biotin-[acetyl-CoA-carboxylase] ligase
MTFDIIHIDETNSTNRWLREHNDDGQNRLVWADYQSAGRGCGSNTWESERGKNLLFSLLIHPHELKAHAQFSISRAISVAIVKALQRLVPDGSLSIKWPNDIYWHDRKLGGILIENRLSGEYVRDSIIGVGLNINQTHFVSDAPNPVSLCQITGREYNRETILLSVVEHFLSNVDTKEYRALLYRCHGFHPYHDSEGDFEAELITVEDDGHLLLRDSHGRLRRYAFKEVQFVLPLRPEAR